MAVKLTKEPIAREYTPVHLLTEEETMSKQAVSPNTKIGVKPSDIDTMVIRECTPIHLMTEEETIPKADVNEDATSKDVIVEKKVRQTSPLMSALPSITIKGVICLIILTINMLCEDNVKGFNFVILAVCMMLVGSIVWQLIKVIKSMFFGDKD